MTRETNRSRHSRTPVLRVLWPPEMECEQNPSQTIHRTATRPKRRLPPEVLSDAEVCALMQACGRYTPTGLRNRALIALLYRTGLRINEALSLYPKDLDLKGGSVRVLFGKGGRSRTVGLDPGAAAIIEHWLDARSRCLMLSLPRCHDVTPSDTTAKRIAEQITRLGCHDVTRRDAKSPSAERGHSAVQPVAFGRYPVFCTLRGQRLSDVYVRRMLKRLAARAGIDKRVHAHGLRHTHAAQLRAEDIDIGIISKQLGHASITTTAGYLDHLAPRAVIEAMRGRTWTEA